MRISFSPQRRDDTLTLERTAPDRLRINGELFNFAPLNEGDVLPEVPCEWIIGPVERISGEVHLTLILPHGPNPSQAVAFPEPIHVTEDGPVAVPRDLSAEEVVSILKHGWDTVPLDIMDAAAQRLEELTEGDDVDPEWDDYGADEDWEGNL